MQIVHYSTFIHYDSPSGLAGLLAELAAPRVFTPPKRHSSAMATRQAASVSAAPWRSRTRSAVISCEGQVIHGDPRGRVVLHGFIWPYNEQKKIQFKWATHENSHFRLKRDARFVMPHEEFQTSKGFS